MREYILLHFASRLAVPEGTSRGVEAAARVAASCRRAARPPDARAVADQAAESPHAEVLARPAHAGQVGVAVGRRVVYRRVEGVTTAVPVDVVVTSFSREVDLLRQIAARVRSD